MKKFVSQRHMMIYKKFMLLICLLIIYISVGDIESYSNNYKSFVDEYKGFYKVYNEQTKQFIFYENRTLNINVGDSIVWINDDPTDRIIIISQQKLWRYEEGALAVIGKRINYTFDNVGTYVFYIQ